MNNENDIYLVEWYPREINPDLDILSCRRDLFSSKYIEIDVIHYDWLNWTKKTPHNDLY